MNGRFDYVGIVEAIYAGNRSVKVSMKCRLGYFYL